MIKLRKVGGIRFWRVGRIGGSFYVARRRAPKGPWRDASGAGVADYAGAVALGLIGGVALFMMF